MAQVNISERALAGIKLVACEMSWERRDALGRFYDFWHDSQDLEKTHCTAKQAAAWLGEERVELLVVALVEAGFLRPDGDRFEIVGNRKHIAAITKKREAGKAGGLAKAAGHRGGEEGPKHPATPEVVASATPEVVADATAHATENSYPVRFGSVPSISLSASDLVDLWQDCRGELPAMISTQLPKKRADLVAEAIKRQPSLDYWRRVIAKMIASDWVSGRDGERSPAGFDFMIEHDFELLEGKYDNPAPKPAASGAPAAAKPKACGECQGGLVRAQVLSSGISEWIGCTCAAGRARTSYPRFDPSRHTKVGAA